MTSDITTNMAISQWLGLICLCGIIATSASQGFLNLGAGSSECEDVCSNTYPLHTYENALHLNFCQRGCRLFAIIDLVNEDYNINGTASACAFSCKEAYREVGDSAACIIGCNAQVSASKKRKEQLSEWSTEGLDEQMNPLYPFLYVHNWYSNMVDKLSQQMTVRWSFYMQSGNGRVVVVSSKPRFYSDDTGYFNSMQYGDDDNDYKTSNYMETNLAAVDNSATPNVKHSQVHGRELGDIRMSVGEPETNDWLGCISRKTGLPRLLLSFTIFVSAVVMIWLCLTTIATAPEQRVKPQKLSINGDLEYLKGLDDKMLLAKLCPQENGVEASPLPIKIQVHRI